MLHTHHLVKSNLLAVLGVGIAPFILKVRTHTQIKWLAQSCLWAPKSAPGQPGCSPQAHLIGCSAVLDDSHGHSVCPPDKTHELRQGRDLQAHFSDVTWRLRETTVTSGCTASWRQNQDYNRILLRYSFLAKRLSVPGKTCIREQTKVGTGISEQNLYLFPRGHGLSCCTYPSNTWECSFLPTEPAHRASGSHRAATGGLVTPGCILWEELGHAEEGVRGGTCQGHSQGDCRGCRPKFLPQRESELTSGLGMSCLLPSIPTGKEWEEEHGLDKQVFLTFSLVFFSFLTWETKCFWGKAEEHLAGRTQSSGHSCRTALIPPLTSLSASKICGLL